MILNKFRLHRDSDNYAPDLTLDIKVTVGDTETTLTIPFDWRRKTTPCIVPVIPLVAEDITVVNSNVLANIPFNKVNAFPSDVNNVMNGQGSFEKV